MYRGEILGFLGPNGAGKTTTIKMILGLVWPDRGRITVEGIDAGRQRAEVLRRVGAVLEGNRNVYWDLTVYENLRYWGTLKQVPPAVLRTRAEELIEFFDLGEKRNTLVKQLSRGMQQKVAIACALIHDPSVILLDEPTLGLDVAAARMVKERVLELARVQGRTVILTTHQLDVAQELCDRVAIMSRGRLQALDATENLIALFSRQEYDFRVEGPVPLAELSRYGRVQALAEENGAGAATGPAAQTAAGSPPEAGVVRFRILLPDADALYEVMETLRRAGVRILAMAKREPGLEEIFLQVVGGQAGPGNHPGAGDWQFREEVAADD
ncbi:MAG: ABC transporter ATP-binding protein [Firmicutes bacterium]|nr:ABC transporter ATP-binding protein [Bacillota bacterium]